ncbi:MAG TPA: hypothetical protein VFH61_16660, partial [Thermoleophilia bacterium]|nr:hypothetical protein [Thermoleophilia bacterium]
MGVDATRTVKIDFVAEDKSVGDVMSGVKGQLIAVAAVAATASKAIQFVGDETARLDRFAKGAQQTGLGFDAYQRLGHVAKLAGTNVEVLAKGSIRLTRQLNELASGRGTVAADNLERLGLTLDDLQGKLPTEQIAIMSDAIASIPSEAQRTAIAVELFGKSGAELVPLLNSGSAAIREMAGDVGKVFTREDLAKAEAYQDALANLEKAAADVKGELAVGVAPVFTEIADEMRASGNTASSVMPMIVKLAANVADGLRAPLAVAGFFAEQLGAVGRVADLVGGRLARVSDRAGELADDFGAFVADSRVGEWARDATAGLDDLGGEADTLTARISDQIPIARELGQTWDEVARALTGTKAAAGELSAIGDAKKAL